MTQDSKVLACVDQSHFADYVADYAAWAAQRISVPLEFLHVIDRHPECASGDDHSGAIGFDAQEQLLSKLAAEDEARSKAAREQGRIFLNRLRERALGARGLTADIKQRHGELEETLVELAGEVRLFVLGRRGESAETTQRDLGRNVEHIVRALDKPLLTVTEGFKEPQRILIAFDGSPLTRRGVQLMAAGSLFRGLPIYVLMSGKARSDAQQQLAWAKTTLETAGFETETALIAGDPESVIAKTVISQRIDLLVMGAYSHSPLRALLAGSKTSDLLRSATIPTLLLR